MAGIVTGWFSVTFCDFSVTVLIWKSGSDWGGGSIKNYTHHVLEKSPAKHPSKPSLKNLMHFHHTFIEELNMSCPALTRCPPRTAIPQNAFILNPPESAPLKCLGVRGLPFQVSRGEVPCSTGEGGRDLWPGLAPRSPGAELTFARWALLVELGRSHALGASALARPIR